MGEFRSITFRNKELISQLLKEEEKFREETVAKARVKRDIVYHKAMDKIKSKS